MQETNNNHYGVGVVGLLQVAFIVLKLCSVISWSWWLVLLPTIISGGLVAIIFIVALILSVIAAFKE